MNNGGNIESVKRRRNNGTSFACKERFRDSNDFRNICKSFLSKDYVCKVDKSFFGKSKIIILEL